MKILAIDIGSAQIKSVIVETKFKRFDITLHDITPVADAWDPAISTDQLLTPGQITTLAAIARRYSSDVNRIVMNLPLSLYSSRYLTFPLKDKRKVQAAVKYAVEDEIPFDLESCIITSHLFPTKTKETKVLTGFAPYAPLEKFLSDLSSIDLSPDCLMMEDAALASQFARLKGEKMKNFAVLNLGHRKSSMFFFLDGMPVLHRTTMVGGYNVSEAIAHRYSINLSEAELAKVDRAFLATPGMQINADQQVFSDTIQSALEPIFSDFQQSLMAFSSRFNGQTIDSVFICGGTALIPGLPEYLNQRWNKKVIPLQITSLFPQISIQPQRGLEWLLPMAAALGLSQVSGEAKSQINFRSGKLQITGRGLQLNFKQFIYPAKVATIMYLVAMLSVIGQTFFLKREVVRKEETFQKAVQSVLGRISPSIISNYLVSPNKLKSSINKKVEEYQSQVQGGNKQNLSSSLDLIHELSKAVPKGTVMEIKQLDYTPKTLTLAIDSPTQADAEKSLGIISKLPIFTNPKASAIEPGKGTRRKFTLTLSLPMQKKGL